LKFRLIALTLVCGVRLAAAAPPQSAPASQSGGATPLADGRVEVIPPPGFRDAATPPVPDATVGAARAWARPGDGDRLLGRVSGRRVLPILGDLDRLDREVPEWLGRTIPIGGGQVRRSRLRSLDDISAYEAWFSADGPRSGAILVAPVEQGTLELVLVGGPGRDREDLRGTWEELLRRVRVLRRRTTTPATPYRDEVQGVVLRPPPPYQDVGGAGAPATQPAPTRAAWVRYGLLGQHALSVAPLGGSAATELRARIAALAGQPPVALDQLPALPPPAAGPGTAYPFVLGGRRTMLLRQTTAGDRLSTSVLLATGRDRVLVLSYLAGRDDFKDQLPAFAALCAQAAPPRRPRWPLILGATVAALLAGLGLWSWGRRRRRAPDS
jgi:hypothetical protein